MNERELDPPETPRSHLEYEYDADLGYSVPECIEDFDSDGNAIEEV